MYNILAIILKTGIIRMHLRLKKELACMDKRLAYRLHVSEGLRLEVCSHSYVANKSIILETKIIRMHL